MQTGEKLKSKKMMRTVTGKTWNRKGRRERKVRERIMKNEK